MSLPIPYGRQHITEADLFAVAETLQSDFLTQGPRIAEFEKALAKYVGSTYAVAVSNGTAALHLCAMALDVKPGQKIITSPITFAASANCILYCGGDVEFADIDSSTLLLDLQAVDKLLMASPAGTYAGIVAVDFAGRAIDLQGLKKLADKYGIWIIEDACHAPGGYFTDDSGKVQNCGNGEFADLAIFSFHPVKHIACGEGGMITTNNKSLYERLLTLRTHGITRDTNKFQNDMQWASGNTHELVTSYPDWYMEMQELGYNYRLTDFQAALGISQLERATENLQKRKEIAGRYAEAFGNKNWLHAQSGSIPGHAFHLYIVEVENRLGLYNHLRSKNIFAQVHYIPVHLMPYYKQQGWKEGDFPLAEKYYSRCLSLPMYPTLKREEQDFVIQTVCNFYNG